jgi:azurin
MKPILFISFLFIIGACSNSNKPTDNQTSSQPNTTDTTSMSASNSGGGSSLMQEGPTYDPTKINPNAPVVNIKLNAVGNNMDEMKYDQTEIRVKAGTTVKLQLVNKAKDASMIHNFVLIEEGTAEKVAMAGLKAGADNHYVQKMKEVLTYTNLAHPGETVEITFPAPEKGTYDFICTYPGHFQKMHGKFIVEAAAS